LFYSYSYESSEESSDNSTDKALCLSIPNDTVPIIPLAVHESVSLDETNMLGFRVLEETEYGSIGAYTVLSDPEYDTEPKTLEDTIDIAVDPTTRKYDLFIKYNRLVGLFDRDDCPAISWVIDNESTDNTIKMANFKNPVWKDAWDKINRSGIFDGRHKGV